MVRDSVVYKCFSIFLKFDFLLTFLRTDAVYRVSSKAASRAQRHFGERFVVFPLKLFKITNTVFFHFQASPIPSRPQVNFTCIHLQRRRRQQLWLRPQMHPPICSTWLRRCSSSSKRELQLKEIVADRRLVEINSSLKSETTVWLIMARRIILVGVVEVLPLPLQLCHHLLTATLPVRTPSFISC